MEANVKNIEKALQDIINLVDREREKDVVSRRFGLTGRTETLEAVGDEMGVTRERVRQIEKVALERLVQKIAADKAPSFLVAEKAFIRELAEMGRSARVVDLTKALLGKTDKKSVAMIHLLTELSKKLTSVKENNFYYQSVTISANEDYEEKDLKAEIDKIVAIVKNNREPLTEDELFEKTSYETPANATALASLSKLLATLNGRWGLEKWPLVNPKNIRDKVFAVLEQNGKPMHYSDIAEAIKNSSFKRKDVTQQAIHNELIKDARFVLVGRGIYGLESWGYKSGTIADVITDILKEAGNPMERKEIVKKVLKVRQVREATILLNLQNKVEFKRVGKGLYSL
jgi:DNA-directed RNA polymerase delta subunit